RPGLVLLRRLDGGVEKPSVVGVLTAVRLGDLVGGRDLLAEVERPLLDDAGEAWVRRGGQPRAAEALVRRPVPGRLQVGFLEEVGRIAEATAEAVPLAALVGVDAPLPDVAGHVVR